MVDYRPRISEKHWDPALEEKLLKQWDEERLYERGEPRQPILVIDTPPPYPSGKWHVGGAAHYAQIDMIARYFRMKGWYVVVPWYADRNGLPIEVAVEKKYNITAHEMAATREGREKFLELCKKELDKIEAELVSLWKRMGCSFEYWRNGTDSEEYRRITQATFIELWRRGLIYEDERPVTWCPRCRTSLSEAEIEHRDEEGYLYFVKWRVKETGEEIVIATTRPELIPAARAVVFHPEDQRYQHLRGKHAIIPLYGEEIPILTHRAVDPEYGTGLVMVSSYGDWTDVMMIQELELRPKIVVTSDGKMNKNAGFLEGLPIREARKKIAARLEEEGLIEKKIRIQHSVPICWRCKTPVEIIHVKEYFLKQLEYRDQLKNLALSIKIRPEKHRKKLLDWIDSLKIDWPISRTRYYGTEIPLWTCRKCGAKLVPEPGKYYRPWKEEPPFEKCPVCGAPREYLEGEKRVFDTWFDSSISVLYASGYLRDEKLFNMVFKEDEEFPYTLRPQGIDIIRTWLYFTLLRVWQLTGKPAFRWVRLTGMGLDPTGRAMHKHLGNVIDPEPFLSKYGGDAFRFWAAIAAKLGEDYRFSEQTLRTGKLFASKLWNIARFTSMFPRPERREVKLRPIDELILARLDEIVETVDKAYGEELDVYTPITLIYEFTWNEFASHYIELVKNRAYNRDSKYTAEEQKAAWYTLHTVVDTVLRMLAPIMPFVTDALYRRLYGKSVHLEEFPQPLGLGRADTKQWRQLMDINKGIWLYKKTNNIRLSEPLPNACIVLSKTLAEYAKEIEDLHHTPVRIVDKIEEIPKESIQISENIAYITSKQYCENIGE